MKTQSDIVRTAQPMPMTIEDLSSGSSLSAAVCAYGDTLRFRVPLQAALETAGGRMRLFRDDDGEVLWLPMTQDAAGDWTVSVPAAEICAVGVCSGLFYFRFEFDTMQQIFVIPFLILVLKNSKSRTELLLLTPL